MRRSGMHLTLLLPLLVLLAGACRPLRVVPGDTLITGIDFSAYTKQGFFFTPEMYDGPYESIGLVTVSLFPAARQVIEAGGIRRWRIDKPSVDEGVAKMYEQAKNMGADALVNFAVRVSDDRLDEWTVRPVLEVSGFAIRRARSSTVVVPNVDVHPPE
jgi:hypothetical protein